jgi:hypothetical protein
MWFEPPFCGEEAPGFNPERLIELLPDLPRAVAISDTACQAPRVRLKIVLQVGFMVEFFRKFVSHPAICKTVPGCLLQMIVTISWLAELSKSEPT